ncbi:PTS sugar transporter subunit IIA [Culicoidibacter larvae]|nr:PTS mannose/fructose/sorbose family IIA subunit [Culicoidibacter larvae]
MLGILVTSHGKFAEGIIDSGTMIAGAQSNVEVVSLTASGIEEFVVQLNDKLQQMSEQYSEVLILCDLKGGTPYNESFRYILTHEAAEQMKLVAGLNLPMYLETVLASGSMAVAELAKFAVECGQANIEVLDF